MVVCLLYYTLHHPPSDYVESLFSSFLKISRFGNGSGPRKRGRHWRFISPQVIIVLGGRRSEKYLLDKWQDRRANNHGRHGALSAKIPYEQLLPTYRTLGEGCHIFSLTIRSCHNAHHFERSCRFYHLPQASHTPLWRPGMPRSPCLCCQ